MSNGPQRGVTRSTVLTMIAGAVVLAASLVVGVWGPLSLALDRWPVESQVPRWLAPLIGLGLLAELAWSLWVSAIRLLRGAREPAWGLITTSAIGAFALWALLGTLGGMSVSDTWLSWFGAALIPIWFAVSLAFWWVLARARYTDRDRPAWPWEGTSNE